MRRANADYMRAHMRVKRRAWRAAGLCGACGRRKSAFYRCISCRRGHNEDQRERIAAHRAS